MISERLQQMKEELEDNDLMPEDFDHVIDAAKIIERQYKELNHKLLRATEKLERSVDMFKKWEPPKV
jgi:hypothetical protein